MKLTQGGFPKHCGHNFSWHRTKLRIFLSECTFTGFPWVDIAEIDPWKDGKERIETSFTFSFRIMDLTQFSGLGDVNLHLSNVADYLSVTEVSSVTSQYQR